MAAPTVFSLSERDRRWRAVKNLLQTRGLDCLLTPPHGAWDGSVATRYLTARLEPGAVCLFTVDGEVLLVGPATIEGQSWVEAVPTTGAQLSRVLVELIQHRFGSAPRIGAVGLAAEHGADDDGFSLVFLNMLESALPDAHWEDCTNMLRAIRAHKSAEEVAVLEAATARAEGILHEIAASLRPGVVDYQAWAAAVAALEAAGSTPPHRARWGAGVRPVLGTRPTHLELHPGFVVLTEIEAAVHGYRGVLPQTFALQACDAGLVELFARYPEFWERALGTLQPGHTVGEMAAACRAIAEDLAPAQGRLVKGEASISLLGSGLGADAPWITNPEDLVQQSDTLIEVGWVFTFAPTLRAQIARRTFTTTWGAVVEITASGPRRLGTLAPGLWTTT